MLIGEWIGLTSVVLANVGSTIGIYMHFNNKIDRVYARFDEFKKTIKDECVQRDLCKAMHDNNSSNLSGLETRLGNRMDNLEKTVSDNFKLIMDQLLKTKGE